MPRPTSLFLSILLAVPSSALAQAPTPPIYQDTADTLRIRLIDAPSGRTLRNTEVEVNSDNGTRCIRAPCPTDGRTWHGRADDQGIVAFPASALGSVNHIRAPAHAFFDLARARRDPADGTWIVQLEAATAAARAGRQHPVSAMALAGLS